MSQLRVGFGLVVAGSVLFVFAGVLRATGENVRTFEGACWQWEGCARYAGGGLGIPHMIVPAALTLLALGYGALALTPQRIDRRLERGFGTLAAGLLMLLAASNLPIAPGTNPAQSLEVVILYGVGLLTGLVGFAVFGVALNGAPAPFLLAASALPMGAVSVVAPALAVLLVVLGAAAYRTRQNRSA